MKINIFGYNIFAKGGTSRSNINLVKSLLEIGHEVHYFNYQDYNKSDITKLIIYEGLSTKHLHIHQFNSGKELAHGDLLIITRETFFNHAYLVKKLNSKIKIVGEIHGPLEYINENIDLALDCIDCVRVSTARIKNEFIAKYDYHRVFNQYVNAQHIDLKSEPINTKRNFLIKARFEDEVKDISYIIKLFNYIIKNQIVDDAQLYLIGYGPSEMLYKNLINYYHLNDYIHINEKEPQSYIYVSSSPYETLGYSILETIAQGNKALVYYGDDNVLKDIYAPYEAIRFLTKDMIKDSKIIKDFLNYKYSHCDRQKDYRQLESTFKCINYGQEFLNNVETFSSSQHVKVKKIHRHLGSEKQIDIASRLKESRWMNLIRKNKYLFNKCKTYYEKRTHMNYIKNLNQIPVDDDSIFIESFHGKNFSGDPKYIALAIKRQYAHKKLYVSSTNSLVDMEIKRYGFTPVRFGSEKYIKTFRKCKYVFINGNSWDKVYKSSEQIFIQTWHGFPLKKMVNDLNEQHERQQQLEAFIPRMKKWDYILTSSDINTTLLESAFMLNKNPNLKVLEYGAPKNEYLINNNNLQERQQLQLKYMYKIDDDKKYILYCPTWRGNQRKEVTQINLKDLLKYLPENYEIIVKLHPNESHLRTRYNQIDNRIHCYFNELVDIQELYILSECMITDYSSTIFDYIHLNKPVFILQEDEQQYKQSVGFYFDLFEVGDFLKASLNERMLAKQICSTDYINYSKVVQRLMKQDSSKSSEKLMTKILGEPEYPRSSNCKQQIS